MPAGADSTLLSRIKSSRESPMEGVMKPAFEATHRVDESFGQIIPFPRSHRNPPVLLLADDDASARQALAERLRAKDFIVYEAASGVEAIDIAEL